MSTREGERRHHVVIVGGGFGGLAAARALRRARVDVTLVDRRNFHLFQPLLYQVATSGLSPGEIASPLRAIFTRHKNVRVVMAEVDGFDLGNQQVILGRQPNGDSQGTIAYDTLVVAAGAKHSYFGNDQWEYLAPGLKTLEDALAIRRRVLRSFEAAEIEHDEAERRGWLTFAVIGAGPTGVELAGQIAEIARHTLKNDYRAIDPREAEVLLIEGTDRVLPPYVPKLSAKAQRSLERLGVTPMLNSLVTDIQLGCVEVKTGEETKTIPAKTVIWAAGVQASPLASMLAEQVGAEVDRAGRITVEPDLTLPGHPEVFAIGDMVSVADGDGGVQRIPGVAPPAMQEGRHVAKTIKTHLQGGKGRPFRYKDKGSLATIGRNAAVADLNGIRFSGLAAWLAWLFIHLFYLAGLSNRFIVFVRWVLSFVTYNRGARLITGEGVEGYPRVTPQNPDPPPWAAPSRPAERDPAS